MEEYYDINDFMSSIDSDRKFLEEIVFNKILISLKEKTDSVCLFNLITGDNEVTSFNLDRKEYDIFLSSYLKACEKREEYEVCSRILEMKKLI